MAKYMPTKWVKPTFCPKQVSCIIFFPIIHSGAERLDCTSSTWTKQQHSNQIRSRETVSKEYYQGSTIKTRQPRDDNIPAHLIKPKSLFTLIIAKAATSPRWHSKHQQQQQQAGRQHHVVTAEDGNKMLLIRPTSTIAIVNIVSFNTSNNSNSNNDEQIN